MTGAHSAGQQLLGRVAEHRSTGLDNFSGELPAYVVTPVLVGVLASLLDVRWAFLIMTGIPLLASGALLLIPATRASILFHEDAYKRGLKAP